MSSAKAGVRARPVPPHPPGLVVRLASRHDVPNTQTNGECASGRVPVQQLAAGFEAPHFLNERRVERYLWCVPLNVTWLIVGIVLIAGCAVGFVLMTRSTAWQAPRRSRFKDPLQGFVSLAVGGIGFGLICIGASFWGW